jgi:hypothetical protein
MARGAVRSHNTAMPAPEVKLADGARSELAVALCRAIASTFERHPERAVALAAMRDRVLVRAEDAGETVTLVFADGGLRIEDGETGAASIRIVGDRDTILALTRLPLRRGLPDLRSDAGRLVVKRQLGGELTVRGLLLRLPQVRHLLQVLAGG